MGITITAENVGDAANMLNIRQHRPGINIEWRKDDFHYDYQHGHEVGCIVDAIGIPGEEVKRCFPSSSDAVRYIAGLLKKHDAFAREQKKKRDKEERARLKKAAK